MTAVASCLVTIRFARTIAEKIGGNPAWIPARSRSDTRPQPGALMLIVSTMVTWYFPSRPPPGTVPRSIARIVGRVSTPSAADTRGVGGSTVAASTANPVRYTVTTTTLTTVATSRATRRGPEPRRATTTTTAHRLANSRRALRIHAQSIR